MKKIIGMLMALIILTSCSKTGTNNTVNLSTNEIADTVLSSVEFPMMLEYEDRSEMESYIGADFEIIEEISCHVQMMSALLAEVIIIIPKDGKMDEVMEYLDNRLEYIKTQAAFYPGQTAAAEAAVAGKKDNIAYLICHEEAGTAENVLLDVLNG